MHLHGKICSKFLIWFHTDQGNAKEILPSTIPKNITTMTEIHSHNVGNLKK